MKRYHYVIIPILVLLSGCQKLKPKSVNVSEYPDFQELLDRQVKSLNGRNIKKQISLEGKSEFKVIEMDSTALAEELSFLREMNPNQPEYVGAFEKSITSDINRLKLRDGENGAIKNVSYQIDNDDFQLIQISFHEDKDVYIHHREVKIEFIDGVIDKIAVDGYQKMMFKDTVRFGVKIEVN